MKIYYSDTFELPLPEHHKFPMAKYRLLRERIAVSPLFKSCQLEIPPEASDDELYLVHDREYVEAVKSGTLDDIQQRRIGFPWSPQMIARSKRSTGASIAAGWAAIKDGVSVNLAGGTHHAFPDAGQGYCVFNDTCVAARFLQANGSIATAMIIDLDVHQGNGTAAITDGDDSLFSFSMHCEKNFPFRKTPGDLDIALAEGTGDHDYLQALNDGLQQAFASFQADIVFYVSGADPFENDRLGKFKLTKPGIRQRDESVFKYCRERNLPVAVSMAGGYAHQVDDIVDIHFNTVQVALDFYQQRAADLSDSESVY